MDDADAQVSMSIGATAVRDHADRETALEDAYDEYALSLYRYALSILGSADDAEDAVQEVFIRLARDRKLLRRARSVKAYLLTAARNSAYSILRARRCRDWLTEDLRWDSHPPASGVAESVVQSNALREALAELPVEQREVLVLKAYEGLTFREIAQVSGASVSTVTSRYQYGIARLRRALGEDQDG
ncbi:MAG: RNA polymerase sigma factor [Armatimonadetes bacterium]|nr:RNA polymerase sigma factor [Armatimonadota bacterium]